MTAVTLRALEEVQASIEACESRRRMLWNRASAGEVIGIDTAGLEAEIASLYARKRQVLAEMRLEAAKRGEVAARRAAGRRRAGTSDS